MITEKKVLVIGSWHLGSVVGSCMAQMGHEVRLWDQHPQTADKWSKGIPPLHEPGLNDLVGNLWQKKLFWAPDLSIAAQADWIVIAYDTPINEKDEVQLGGVWDGFRKVCEYELKSHVNIFVTAQVPVGTCREFKLELKTKFPQWKGHVFYQPENLRLGQAIQCFTNPDRMVIGVDCENPLEKDGLIEDCQNLLGNFHSPINVMSLESAEMVKHALNSFLGTCVVFANQISDICEGKGANAWDVLSSLKQDTRVGQKAFLSPGLGFSGGTLARDIKTLSRLSPDGSDLFSELYELNAVRNNWIVNQLRTQIGTLSGKKIILLGVTYKPGTSTVRRSLALDIGRLLNDQGASCVALDPMADLGELSPEERKDIPFELAVDSISAFKDASAAIVMTEWPQFMELPWRELSKVMKSPVLIDAKNMYARLTLPPVMRKVVPGLPRGVTTDVRI